jgi:hypothetical protein
VSIVSRSFEDDTIAIIREMVKALFIRSIEEVVISVDTSIDLEGVSLEALNCWNWDTLKKSMRIDLSDPWELNHSIGEVKAQGECHDFATDGFILDKTCVEFDAYGYGLAQ